MMDDKTPRAVELHEHSNGRVFAACMDQGQADSVSALLKVWYENGQITHCEGAVVSYDTGETAHDGIGGCMCGCPPGQEGPEGVDGGPR